MFAKILGVMWIILGILCLFKPQILKNRLKKKMNRAMRRTVYGFILVFGFLLMGSAIKAEGIIPKIILVAGMIVAIKAIILITSRTSEKIFDWWADRPLFFFRLWALTVFVIGLLLVVSAGHAEETRSGGINEKRPETAAVEKEIWTEDMDKKIDTTIEVLKVIKEEMKDADAGEALREKAPEWKENLRKAVSATGRIWKRVRKATGRGSAEETAAPADAPEDGTEWTRDMRGKLDKSIEAINVIKEALDKIEEDEKGGEKQDVPG